MIDIHNHLLPGIDDGATNVEVALEMARMAVKDGITHIVCTPHIHPGRYSNTASSIEQARKTFSDRLRQDNIPLHIAAAAEVRFGIEIMQNIRDGDIPFLGEWQGYKILLLEFPHGQMPFGAERLVQWLLRRRIKPMIAHPERNKAVMRQPGLLRPLIQQGCLLQITAASITGGFGPAAHRTAHLLLERDLVTVIASDAHNLKHRPPTLSKAVEHAARVVGIKKAEQLVEDLPRRIAQMHFG